MPYPEQFSNYSIPLLYTAAVGAQNRNLSAHAQVYPTFAHHHVSSFRHQIVSLFNL